MENYSNSINSSQEKINQLFGENENASSAYRNTVTLISNPVPVGRDLLISRESNGYGKYALLPTLL